MSNQNYLTYYIKVMYTQQRRVKGQIGQQGRFIIAFSTGNNCMNWRQCCHSLK